MSENKLTNLCEVSNGDTPPKEDGYVPVYGANGIIGSTDKTNFEGGIIVGRVGSSGESHYVDQPVWVSDNALTLSNQSEKYTEKYLYYFISSCKEELLSYAGIGVQPIINQKHLSWLEPPKIPVEEQERIVELLSDVDMYIEKTNKRIQTLQQQKQAVLQQVFENEDGIGTQNPFQKYKINSNWTNTSLGSFVQENGQEIVDGDWVESDDMVESGGVKMIQLGNLKRNKIVGPFDKRVTKDWCKDNNVTILQDNDVIAARMPDPIFRSNVVSEEYSGEYIVPVDIMIIRGLSSSKAKYVSQYLNSYYAETQGNTYATGSTRDRISRKNAEKIGIPIPPEEELENINRVLSKFDKDLELANTDLQYMKDLKQGLLQEIFSD